MFGSLFEIKGPITPKLPSLKGQPIYEAIVGESLLRMVLPPHNPFDGAIHKEINWAGVVNSLHEFGSSDDAKYSKSKEYKLTEKTICQRYWKLGGSFLGGAVGQIYLVLTAGFIDSERENLNIFDANELKSFVVSEIHKTYSSFISRGNAFYRAPLNWCWQSVNGLPCVKFDIEGGQDAHIYRDFLVPIARNQYLNFGFVIRDKISKHSEAQVDRAPIYKFIEEMMSLVKIELGESAQQKQQLAHAYAPRELPIQPPLHFTTPEQDRFAAWEALNSAIFHLFDRVPHDHPLVGKLFEFQQALKVDAYRKPEEDGDYSIPAGVQDTLPPDLAALFQEYQRKPKLYNKEI